MRRPPGSRRAAPRSAVLQRPPPRDFLVKDLGHASPAPLTLLTEVPGHSAQRQTRTWVGPEPLPALGTGEDRGHRTARASEGHGHSQINLSCLFYE